jgi:PAS domain S-box-containing protein
MDQEQKKNEKVASMGEDIRKLAEQLKSQEEQVEVEKARLLALLDGIEDVIYVSDPDTYELLHFNQKMHQTWPNAKLGEKCYKVLQDRDEPCPFCTNDIIFGDMRGKVYEWEFQNEVNQRWYRCADKAIPWVDGRLVRFELATDISYVKEMEAQLRHSEEHYRLLTETSQDFIFLINRDLRVEYVNQHAAGAMGDTPEAIIGRSTFDVFPRNVAERQAIGLKTVFESGAPAQSESVTIMRGKERWLSTRLVPIKNEDGYVRAVMGVSRDITERKLAEDEIAKHAKDLARSNEELEQFAYVASHDLQEPLRMISSYLQLIERRYKGQLGDDADEFIHYAVDGANRLQRLINDLLTFSRVRSQAKPHVPVSMKKIVQSAVDNLGIAIEEKGADVVIGDLPNLVGDEIQLIQLYQNLIGNGIKFQRQGETPIITIGSEAHPANTKLQKFFVRDNGIGISDSDINKVFVIFKRLNARDAYEGTGIGLAVCKKIVQQHGGEIWLESELGVGTTFWFTLPLSFEHTTE